MLFVLDEFGEFDVLKMSPDSVYEVIKLVCVVKIDEFGDLMGLLRVFWGLLRVF